tara:strand:- start:3 stop:395 length:393 start_codon:yes stop_codon:yes gene_type:complete
MLSQVTSFNEQFEQGSDMRSITSRLSIAMRAFEPWLQRCELLRNLVHEAGKNVPTHILIYARTKPEARVAQVLSNGSILHTAVASDAPTCLFLPNTCWLAVVAINMSPTDVVQEFNLSLVYAQRWICWNL